MEKIEEIIFNAFVTVILSIWITKGGLNSFIFKIKKIFMTKECKMKNAIKDFKKNKGLNVWQCKWCGDNKIRTSTHNHFSVYGGDGFRHNGYNSFYLNGYFYYYCFNCRETFEVDAKIIKQLYREKWK